jgi:hypothetical protein
MDQNIIFPPSYYLWKLQIFDIGIWEKDDKRLFIYRSSDTLQIEVIGREYKRIDTN